MAKFRMTVTYVYEYEINPEYYEGMTTDQERMDSDIKSYQDDPAMLDLKDAREFTVKGELI